MLTSNSQLPYAERRVLLEELETFRRARVALGLSHSEDGASQRGAPAFFFHVLPVGGLNDVVPLTQLPARLRMENPFGDLLGWNGRFNADGYVVRSDDGGIDPSRHAQRFRFGGIEAYSAELVTISGEDSLVRVPALATSVLTRIVLSGVVDAVGVLRSVLGVSAPLALSASLVGMQDVLFRDREWGTAGKRIGRAEVFTPWVTVDPDAEPDAAVRAVADVLWQSAGYVKSPSTAE